MPTGVHERFMAKVVALDDEDGGCWAWIAGKTSNGYGAFWPKHGQQIGSHRYAYLYFNGPIPDGYQIDHLCRNRWCCNPEHLEAVTCRENLLRGVGLNALNAAKDHCPQGHPYSGENLYVNPGTGRRTCRTCKRAHAIRYRDAARYATSND